MKKNTRKLIMQVFILRRNAIKLCSLYLNYTKSYFKLVKLNDIKQKQKLNEKKILKEKKLSPVRQKIAHK